MIDAIKSLVGRLTGLNLGAVLWYWLGLGILLAVIWWQCFTIGELREWKGNVLDSLSNAVDQRDAKGQLLPISAEDAAKHILALGRLKTDVAEASATATASDLAHVLEVGKQDDAINRKASDDFASKIATARADAARLRVALAAPVAGGVQPASGAAGNGDGQGSATGMSALSAASGGVVASPGADGLSASAEGTALICTPLNIDERLLATEQALQLDALINAIYGFAEVER